MDNKELNEYQKFDIIRKKIGYTLPIQYIVKSDLTIIRDLVQCICNETTPHTVVYPKELIFTNEFRDCFYNYYVIRTNNYEQGEEHFKQFQNILLHFDDITDYLYNLIKD